MAFDYGFYNSLNHDKRYNTEQFANLFNCLIKDGVFNNVGSVFGTTVGAGLQVIVKPGLGWFNSTWNSNDSALPLSLQAADVTLTRFDAVILEIGSFARTNLIKIVTGVPSVTPAKPELINTETLHQHPLAYIRVAGGATAISATDIEITVGTAVCPFVTGILETADISVLFADWNHQFTVWFDNLKLQLTDNVVANLQRQIDVLKASVHGTYTGATVPDVNMGRNGDVYVKTK